MSTRLVERLERDIAQAKNPLERECLKAQHAAAVARLGMLAQARFTLAGLRTQSRRYGKSKLQAWVHFVDGTISYFSAVNSTQALTQFKTARAVAIECGEAQLQALACAWAAAVEIQNRQDADMLASLSEAMQLANEDNHPAWARAWLVLADAADYAGWFEASMRCYEQARVHAVSNGDATTISLMMCNRANSLVSHHVRRELFGTDTATGVQRALSEIESTNNLDRGLGNTALGSSAPLIQAEVLVVLGRWADSITLVDQNLAQQEIDGGIRFAARQLANRAWCHANLRHHELALADANAAEASLSQVSDPDDLAVVHQRLARTFDILGLADRVPPHADAARQAMLNLSADQTRLGERLNQFKQSMKDLGHPWLHA
jgi:tetratricopeptide (TPR) repeat protein